MQSRHRLGAILYGKKSNERRRRRAHERSIPSMQCIEAHSCRTFLPCSLILPAPDTLIKQITKSFRVRSVERAGNHRKADSQSCVSLLFSYIVNSFSFLAICCCCYCWLVVGIAVILFWSPSLFSSRLSHPSLALSASPRKLLTRQPKPP